VTKLGAPEPRCGRRFAVPARCSFRLLPLVRSV